MKSTVVDPVSTRVDALMTRDLISVAPDTPIRDAAERMLTSRIGGVPVVDDSGAPVGVLSLRDVLAALSHSQQHAHKSQALAADAPTLYFGALHLHERIAALPDDVLLSGDVSQWMSDVVLVCNRNDSVATAAQTMARRSVHRLLVVDGGKLVGLLSALDIAAFVGRVN